MATRIDSTGWRRKRARLQAARLNARVDATQALGGAVARRIVQTGPRDTNRFVRAYAQANNAIADAKILPPPLEESRTLNEIVSRLVRQRDTAKAQVERWERNVASYRRRRQLSTDSGRAAAKYLRQWKKQLSQAEEQLERLKNEPGVDAVILIGGRRRKRAGAFGPKTGVARIKTEVYGGAGRLVEAGGRLFAELRNREPHARLVNRRTRVVSNAVQSVRAQGARFASPAYLKRLREAGRRAA